MVLPPYLFFSYGQVYRVLRGGSYVDAAEATIRCTNKPELRMHEIGY